jgi:hypothetical protein
MSRRAATTTESDANFASHSGLICRTRMKCQCRCSGGIDRVVGNLHEVGSSGGNGSRCHHQELAINTSAK